MIIQKIYDFNNLITHQSKKNLLKKQIKRKKIIWKKFLLARKFPRFLYFTPKCLWTKKYLLIQDIWGNALQKNFFLLVGKFCGWMLFPENLSTFCILIFLCFFLENFLGKFFFVGFGNQKSFTITWNLCNEIYMRVSLQITVKRVWISAH